MSFYIAVKNKDGDFDHYKVPEEVYIYVKQLELCIKYPEQSRLKEVYPERFSNTKNLFLDF